jgi:hypothetical protein
MSLLGKYESEDDTVHNNGVKRNSSQEEPLPPNDKQPQSFWKVPDHAPEDERMRSYHDNFDNNKVRMLHITVCITKRKRKFQMTVSRLETTPPRSYPIPRAKPEKEAHHRSSSSSSSEEDSGSSSSDESVEERKSPKIRHGEKRSSRDKSRRRSGKGKIIEKDFTPRTRKLAKECKVNARKCIVVRHLFPHDMHEAIWDELAHTLNQKAQRGMVDEHKALTNTYLKVDKKDSLKYQVITFVSYTLFDERETQKALGELCSRNRQK